MISFSTLPGPDWYTDDMIGAMSPTFRAAVIEEVLASAGTTEAHTESVNFPWADGQGHTSYRLTPADAATLRVLLVGFRVTVRRP